MKGSTARKLRKLMDLKRSNLEPTEMVPIGHKQVYVIDGVNNELRTEERPKYQAFCDENKRLYRKLKKELNANSEIGQKLREDLSKNDNQVVVD